jgi:hypothetical protein
MSSKMMNWMFGMALMSLALFSGVGLAKSVNAHDVASTIETMSQDTSETTSQDTSDLLIGAHDTSAAPEMMPQDGYAAGPYYTAAVAYNAAYRLAALGYYTYVYYYAGYWWVAYW